MAERRYTVRSALSMTKKDVGVLVTQDDKAVRFISETSPGLFRDSIDHEDSLGVVMDRYRNFVFYLEEGETEDGSEDADRGTAEEPGGAGGGEDGN